MSTNNGLKSRLWIREITVNASRSHCRPQFRAIVLWADDGDWVKKGMSYEVEGVRGRGRPRTTWSHVVERGHERAWFQKGGCAGA